MGIPKIAIVHDALVNSGGAERTVTYMCEAFPQATIFTSAYLPEMTFPEFRERYIYTLPGSRLVHSERGAKQLLLYWMVGFRKLNLSGFDAVLSSTTFAAKYINPPKTIRHACYCYAPFRLLWKPEVYTKDSLPVNSGIKLIISLFRPWLKRLDYRVMQKVPKIATTCQNMAKEIQIHYNRNARIIHVPVRLSDFQVGSGNGSYYLSVSRLISHKRVDLAIDACNRLKKPLVVVGDGPEKGALMKMAKGDITFLGSVSDLKLHELYKNCLALIFASHEDYGLTPIEVQASGRPVIAYGIGGVLETVVENKTGVFFRQQSTETLIDAIQRFEKMEFDPQSIRDNVKQFDVEHFKSEIQDFVFTL